jgi:uncharacterized membrane protein (DUF2068 family)
MNQDTHNSPTAAPAERIVDKLLAALRAPGSYLTRIWTALFLPLAIGTVLDWPTRAKFEGLLLSLLVVTVYTAFHLVWKRYLK